MSARVQQTQPLRLYWPTPRLAYTRTGTCRDGSSFTMLLKLLLITCCRSSVNIQDEGLMIPDSYVISILDRLEWAPGMGILYPNPFSRSGICGPPLTRGSSSPDRLPFPDDDYHG